MLVATALTACTNKNQTKTEENMNTTLTLTQEWDKTFPKSDKVDHKKVTFRNRYGIELAADMYIPKAPLRPPRGTQVPQRVIKPPSPREGLGVGSSLHWPSAGHSEP